MKLVQEATHHFMFQEFWASHYPLVQALSIFPNSELVVMVHTAHPRYTSGWASSAKADLGGWWEQLRGNKCQVRSFYLRPDKLWITEPRYEDKISPLN